MVNLAVASGHLLRLGLRTTLVGFGLALYTHLLSKIKAHPTRRGGLLGFRFMRWPMAGMGVVGLGMMLVAVL